MNDKPKLSTKNICDLLGISPTAIRLYEKHLRERRYGVSEAGYRQFDSASLVQLYNMRYLAKCGLSVKDAALTCQSPRLEDKVEALRKAEGIIRKTRDYYEAALRETARMREMLQDIPSLDRGFEYVERPEFLFLECERDGKVARDPVTRALMREWVGLMPVVSFAYSVKLDDPVNGEWSYHLGLSIPDRYAHLVDASAEGVRRVPAQTCLATTSPDTDFESTRAGDYLYAKKVLRKGFEFMEQEGVKLAGEIFDHLIATNVRLPASSSVGDVPCDYYRTTYPI